MRKLAVTSSSPLHTGSANTVASTRSCRGRTVVVGIPPIFWAKVSHTARTKAEGSLLGGLPYEGKKNLIIENKEGVFQLHRFQNYKQLSENGFIKLFLVKF